MPVIRTVHVAKLVSATSMLVLLAGGCVAPDQDGPIVLVTRQVPAPDNVQCDEVRPVCDSAGFVITYRTGSHEAAARYYGATEWTYTNQAVLTASCGGTEFGRSNLATFQTDNTASRLAFEGGDEAVLTAGSIVQVVPFSDTSFTCDEERGSWEGTAGGLQGRSGSYLVVDNGLQTVLTLTDDG